MWRDMTTQLHATTMKFSYTSQITCWCVMVQYNSDGQQPEVFYWFQLIMVLFTEEYCEKLFSVSWSYFSKYARPYSDSSSRSLFPIAFQARLPVYVLKRAHIKSINLRCAKVSQTDSFILLANLAALLSTRFKALTWPPLYRPQTPLHTQISVPTHRSILNYRSQHTTPHSIIGPNTPLHTQISDPTYRSILKYRS